MGYFEFFLIDHFRFITALLGIVVILGTAFEFRRERLSRFVPVDDDEPLLNAAGDDSNTEPGCWLK